MKIALFLQFLTGLHQPQIHIIHFYVQPVLHGGMGMESCIILLSRLKTQDVNTWDFF